ncbi:MAG: hypothetical protein CFK52_01105 [Chloracidobacterium sp. CP2_5A]|nr:MAG: hypothetical protein CFK52_01105 [Chloracidobacterium sp. CP2_5A]
MKPAATFTRARLAWRSFLVAALVAASAAAFAAPRPPGKTKPSAKRAALPAPVVWREDRRGLRVPVWINGAGPFAFVVDTGAGLTLLSPRAASQARVTDTGRVIILQGAGQGAGAPQRLVAARTLAIGDADNFLPNVGRMVIAPALPADVDGALDPTEAFGEMGYELDFPNQTLAPLSERQPLNGAPARWLLEPAGRRPFTRINGQEIALIDTGSSFGLAIPDAKAASFGIRSVGRPALRSAQDVAGGSFQVARVAPTKFWLGSLYLEQAPTDILYGADAAAPLLLGRDALRPFHIRFDLRRRVMVFGLPEDKPAPRPAARD